MAGGRGTSAGEKKKNEAVSNKMRKKEKGNRKQEKEKKKWKRGRVIFFVTIWHTFVDNCILT